MDKAILVLSNIFLELNNFFQHYSNCKLMNSSVDIMRNKKHIFSISSDKILLCADAGNYFAIF